MDQAEGLNLTAEELVRVYCDISRESEMKLRLRCIQLQQETGRKYTRKEYLERLIADDIAKVKGASFRELKNRKQAGYSLFVFALAAVALISATALFFSSKYVAHVDERCTAAGGVPVHMSSGILCLSPDAIKKPAAE